MEIFNEFQRPNGITWFYLSTLLAIALYFRFSRVWALRNWDLLALFALVPGLLIVTRYDRLQERREPPSAVAQVSQPSRSTFARDPVVQPPNSSAEVAQPPELSITPWPGSPTPAPPTEFSASDRPVSIEMPRLIQNPSANSTQPEVTIAPQPTTTPLPPSTPADEAGQPVEPNEPDEPTNPETDEGSDTFLTGLANWLPAPAVGYFWLLLATCYWLFRSFIDLFLNRRPRWEPNLERGGLIFLALALLGFLIHHILVEPINHLDPVRYTQTPDATPALEPTALLGPTAEPPKPVIPEAPQAKPMRQFELPLRRSVAILAHLLILLALVAIGWQHFGSPGNAIGMATLYLLLPITMINALKVDQLLPTALLLSSFYGYRHPRLTGTLFGVAGIFFYPLFLVPLWSGFYLGVSRKRFLIYFSVTFVVLALLVWGVASVRVLVEGWTAWFWTSGGFWTIQTHFYRLPIAIVYLFFMLGVAFWPRDKNLGDLLALSAMLLLGIQFWYPERGGTYVHWYCPLLLLIAFRPSLTSARPPMVQPTTTRRTSDSNTPPIAA